VLRRAPNATRAPHLNLRALGTQREVRWLLDGKLIGQTRADSSLLAEFDREGVRHLLALDRDGRYAALDVMVEL
jgi:penicillin-binding protein 1C